MPLFISDADVQAAGADVALVVARADAYIHDLLQQLETHKARADAASITAEQSCAIIEQKFFSLSSQHKRLEEEKTQLDSALERRSAELAEAQAQVHILELESMKKDSDRERFSCELNEVRVARRELLEIVDQKNAELNEKNSCIKTYLDKIVFLTDERSILEGKVRKFEAEMGRSHALQARLTQEKELLEQHNLWLNEELTDKVNTLLRERRTSADLEMELSSKLLRSEQLCKEIGESLQRSKGQMKDLDSKLSQTREELRFTKEDAASKEDHLSLEIATASKLAELYKQSSEEWSKKAIDLEGVIKALEVHLNQIERDSREQIEKEVQAHTFFEKEAVEMKQRVEKLERELESSKKTKEQDSLLAIANFADAAPKELDISDQQLSLEIHGEGSMLPIVPSGISATALVDALLRDGWSLTKVYIKYQEAVDAWRHERQERKQSQALLQRVLREIEERVDVIMDERAEHVRMVEAYSVMEEKLYSSIDEQGSLENAVRELKAELRKRERDLISAQKECSDLQSQVTVLLKECSDVQERFGIGGNISVKGGLLEELTASDAVISDRLLTFKDIRGMVEQNSQLRAIVRSLGHQNEEREKEMKDAFDLELKKRTDEATHKVSAVLKKSEEQSELIASLQGTVGMYKRLYEEVVKSHGNIKQNNGDFVPAAGASGEDMRRLVERSQEEMEKVRKEASERLSLLEDELRKTKQDANAARFERDRLIVEAAYAREQLQAIVKDSENQRKAMDAVLARNVEFSQTITDYQRRLRENSEYVQSVDDKSRRLSVEVSVLEREKELISSAERRVSQELSSLSERVHRLQATLDNIHTVEEARESMRSAEKKKLEEDGNRMQKEWVEMKHELDSERAHIRHLTNERDEVLKQAMDRVESISKELADALRQVSVAETHAHVAEVRCMELETSLRKAEEKIFAALAGGKMDQHSKSTALEDDDEAVSMLSEVREEIERLKEELDASKNHTEQYKRLAQVNEEALERMEDAHNRFKEEAEKAKEYLNSEISSLRERLTELEKQAVEREKALVAAEAQKERSLSEAEREIMLLHESESSKRMMIEQAEERIRTLKDELEKEHHQWRTAQNNYERQVLLQADTIRELTIVSERQAMLEKEARELQAKADASISELSSSNVAWEMEKSALICDKEVLQKNVKELDEQNQILLDRVEAMHILRAEHDRKGGEAIKGPGEVENDLQDVIRYLRRSKETSDTEITLLKQERLRLQKQLESALRAAEEAHANLRLEQENARASLCSEEEFRSLQAQVREMSLLRESNVQLRLENKRNFEDCRDLRERAQKEQSDVESLRRSLGEREVELEAAGNDAELQKAEIIRWQNRVSELLQKYKAVDMEEYQRTQAELEATQETLRLQQVELEAARGELKKLQETILSREQEGTVKDDRVAELEKKVQESLQSEVTSKAEVEKFKKQALFLKRRIETLTKDKEDAVKEREACLKQIDDLKANSGKRSLGDSLRSEAQIRQELISQHEQAQKENENLLKEKESRIQSLERTLEREREDLRKEREEVRKEKAKRLKDQKLYFDVARKQDMEKQKLQEELSILKREKEAYAENMQTRKTVRTRIIRPKIEPPSQSEMQAEAGELVNDMAIEVSEAEAEMQDELKSLETSEIVCTTSAIVVASNAPLPDVIVTGVRKRPSMSHDSIAETSLEQESKNERAPLLKKQKGIDMKQVLVESDSASVTVAESLVTTEPLKEVVMDLEHAAGNDLDLLDRNVLKNVALVENQHAADVAERGNAPIESMTSKRPRIFRSDGSHQPQVTVQRDDKVVETEEDKTTSEQEQQLSERNLHEERDEQSLSGDKGELMHHDLQRTLSPPPFDEKFSGFLEQGPKSSPQPTHVNAVEPPAMQPLPLENAPGFEIEKAETLLVDLSTSADVSVASGDMQTSSELEVPSILSFGGRTAEMNSTIEGPMPRTPEVGSITEGPTESGEDVEDGEIEPDGIEDNTMEISSLKASVDSQEEVDRTGGSFYLDSVEVEAEHSDETKDDERPDPSIGEPSQHSKDITSLEGSASEHQADGVQSVTSEKSGSRTVARQAAKNPTIHLAERTKERILIRRSGMPPPSPGKRTVRGVKKSLGAQRGQTAPSNPRPQGTEDKEAHPSQTLGAAGARHIGSQSAPTSNKLNAQKDEQD